MFQFALLPRVRTCLTSLAEEEKSKEIGKKRVSKSLQGSLVSLTPKPRRAEKAELKEKRAKTKAD